ncbi:hypothetical protein Poli38472_006141 [Pythium oligandrum]|uniref:Ribonuclease P/MRP protein subunit POP5 n=1 Tax=Pythium oligandrum TaxID=41045 RepID=A0A8K1CTJ3_PYTOL|nr:hypothetical protein Poli38472_006141 [Pythium oligandrum]|eukprot:TMW68673.1 hypothetical protein Poli38472_006141 [Pythium oligandrum]
MATPHHKFSLRSEYSYLKIGIFSVDGSAVVSDIKRLKFALNNELRAVFGEVGASMAEFDLLTLQKATKEASATAILRIRSSELKTLWGALTMCTSIDSKLCKLHVLHVSSSLLALASPRFL